MLAHVGLRFVIGHVTIRLAEGGPLTPTLYLASLLRYYASSVR